MKDFARNNFFSPFVFNILRGTAGRGWGRTYEKYYLYVLICIRWHRFAPISPPKSKGIKILRVTPLDARFCVEEFFPPPCFQYFTGISGEGVFCLDMRWIPLHCATWLR